MVLRKVQCLPGESYIYLIFQVMEVASGTNEAVSTTKLCKSSNPVVRQFLRKSPIMATVEKT